MYFCSLENHLQEGSLLLFAVLIHTSFVDNIMYIYLPTAPLMCSSKNCTLNTLKGKHREHFKDKEHVNIKYLEHIKQLEHIKYQKRV